MRLNDIMNESEINEYDLNKASASNNNTRERPQNFLGRLKTGLSTLHPFNSNIRNKALGIQQVSRQANELMANYQQWLGRSNQDQPTKQNLITWMKQKRLPLTGEVAELLKAIQAPAPKVATPPATTPTSPATNSTTNTTPTSTPAPTTPNTAATPTKVKEAVKDTPIPITNQQASEIISTAIGIINQGKTFNSNTSRSASQSTGGSVGNIAPQANPNAINIPSIVDFYKNLPDTGPNSKDELKKQIQDVDTQPKPAANTTPPVAEGHSRFLGMTL